MLIHKQAVLKMAVGMSLAWCWTNGLCGTDDYRLRVPSCMLQHPWAGSAPSSILGLVPFSGSASDSKEKPLVGEIGAAFLVDKDQEQGEPRSLNRGLSAWLKFGHYKVQLGAAKPSGLPNTNGTIHFAPAQTFPGATRSGTITGVTAGSGLSGGGTSGSVSLKVDSGISQRRRPITPSAAPPQLLSKLMKMGGMEPGAPASWIRSRYPVWLRHIREWSAIQNRSSTRSSEQAPGTRP